MILMAFDKYEHRIADIDTVVSCQHTEKDGENTLSVLGYSIPQDAKYLAFRDLDGDIQLFEIRIRDDSPTSRQTQLYAEHAFYELLTDYPIEDIRPTEVQAAMALTQALEGTRWQAGNAIETTVASTRWYYIPRTTALANIAATWDVRLKPRITVSGAAITGRYIDIVSNTPVWRGKRFEIRKDVLEAKYTLDDRNVITALIGRGKGEETGDGYGRRIDFADVVWSKANGDPADKPAGQKYVEDPEATAQYGVLGIRPRVTTKVYSSIEDPAALLSAAWADLQAACQPVLSSTLTVMDLERIGFPHEAARFGDAVAFIADGIRARSTIVSVVREYAQAGQDVVQLGALRESVVAGIAKINRDLSTTATAAATAQTAANNAQTTANTASTSAATANSLLTDMASDSKLTPLEKQSTKQKWDIIVSEKTKIDAQADVYGVSKTAYGTAYSSLNTYITPLLTSLTATSDITGTTFRSMFKAYYDARQDILNAISTAAKTLADAAQSTASGAATAAATGTALAQANPSLLQGVIDTMITRIISTGTGITTDPMDGGMVFTNAAGTGAVKITGQGIIIANEKVGDSWQWRTALAGDGVAADAITTGILRANLIKILGTDQFYWDASNIFIIDPTNSTRQIRIGCYDGTNYGIGYTQDGGATWQNAIGFNGVTFSVQAIQDQLNGLAGTVSTLNSLVTTSMRLTSQGLRVGQSNVNSSVLIAADGVHIQDEKNNEVTKITNSTMEIENAKIRQQLILGEVVLFKMDDGSLFIKGVGDE